MLNCVQRDVASCISYDAYQNCHVDVTPLSMLIDKTYAKAFQELLPELKEMARDSWNHMLTIKFLQTHVRLHKYVLQEGFKFHFADEKVAIVKACLRNHEVEICDFPRHKNVSAGIMAVVFNQDRSKFLCVQEKVGPHLKFKPMTGIINDEKQETPLEAAVREIGEEVGVHVDPQTAVFAGQAWTPDLRNGRPDTNSVFAFVVEEAKQHLKAQETEIKAIKWVSVEEFLPSQTVGVSGSLIFQDAVRAALHALNAHHGHVQRSAWGSGRKVEFYSANIGDSV